MKIFAKRLKERARQLGISNSEVARRTGLEERRYGHYVTGRNEPDLATFKRIAEVLGTTPNWLLDVGDGVDKEPEKAALTDRFANASSGMTLDELKLCVIQAEAIVANKNNE